MKSNTIQVSSLQEALSVVKPNQNVFVHGTSATPFGLIEGLVAQANRLENVTLHHLHVEGDAPMRSLDLKEYSE